MIRFIDLGDQITEGFREFAWFDTISDSFIDLCGEQTWETWERFEGSLNHTMRLDPDSFTLVGGIDRFRRLFPKDWPL